MAEERTVVPGPTDRTAGGRSLEVSPASPEAVRTEIEHTRARMSETIDEIEEVLLRRKEKLQSSLDVMSKVRDRPFPSLGIVFASGLALGFITGGGNGDHEPRRLDEADRAELWEDRARRLLHIAQEQERELEQLRATKSSVPADRPATGSADSAAERDDPDSRLDRLQEMFTERIGHFVERSVRDLFGGSENT